MIKLHPSPLPGLLKRWAGPLAALGCLCPARPLHHKGLCPKRTAAKVKKSAKIFLKKFLTHTGVLLYHSQAPVKAQSAMMREIAANAGNFRGVCPHNVDFPRQGRGPVARGTGRMAAPGRNQCYINSRRLMPPAPPPAARKGVRPFRIDTIGRLRDPCHGVYRPAGRKPACLCAGFFVAGSDTHESVDTRNALTVRRLDKVNFRMY